MKEKGRGKMEKYRFNTYLYVWEPDPEGEFYLDDDVDAAMKEKEADIAMLKAEIRHWEGSRDGVLECLDKNEYEKIQVEDDNSALREQNSAMNESLVKLREVLKKCLDWLSEYTDSELVAEVKSALKEPEVKDE